MMRLLPLLALSALVALGGCAATVSQPGGTASTLQAPTAQTKRVALLITGSPTARQSADWQTFRAEWRGAFEAAATSAGLGFAYFEADPPRQPAGTALVRISVNDYRYLSTGARYGFGAMTGNAFIDAQAEFVELPAGRRLGTRQYATSSSAWQGIFSAMTSKQVAALSTQIVQDVQRR